MSQKVTPEVRREVIRETGLCTNPNCVAHDSIVANIWRYKCEAEERGYDLGKTSCKFSWPNGFVEP